MITNLDIYLAIAEEALAESERLEGLARAPKPDDAPGFIVKYDPERKSFKNSLVAIAFAGMYLEALFYILGVGKFGVAEYNKKHDRKSYIVKMKLLGLSEQTIVAEGERFAGVRNALVHEKAIELGDITVDKIQVGQEEARRAITFVKHVAERLRGARHATKLE